MSPFTSGQAVNVIKGLKNPAMWTRRRAGSEIFMKVLWTRGENYQYYFLVSRVILTSFFGILEDIPVRRDQLFTSMTGQRQSKVFNNLIRFNQYL